ncbi:MAG: DsrE family protein [Nitrospinae bacterium]|nr:DsrE family protein [Nitrospinota bacterium]
MEKITMVITEGPGSLKAWNGLRAAAAFRGVDLAVTVFLMDDGVYNAKKGQEPVDGLRELDMAKKLKELQGIGVDVIVCGTCQKARGLQAEEFVDGVKLGSMMDMAKSVKESKTAMTF